MRTDPPRAAPFPKATFGRDEGAMNRSRASLRPRSAFRHPRYADRPDPTAPAFALPSPAPTMPGGRRAGKKERALPFPSVLVSLSLSLSVLAAGCQRSDLKLPESIRQKIAESNRSASQTKAMTPLPTVPSDGVSSRFTVRPFEDWTMREAAAVALSRIGEPAVPALVEALQSPDPNLRQQAADTLARIGPAASTAVPALTALLDDPDPRVKKSAVRALGQIGPAAANAVPSLMRALE